MSVAVEGAAKGQLLTTTEPAPPLPDSFAKSGCQEFPQEGPPQICFSSPLHDSVHFLCL